MLVIMKGLVQWNSVYSRKDCSPVGLTPGTLDQQAIAKPLYTGGLFHCYMLDDSICHFGVSGLSLYSIFDGNNVDPDQTTHYVASDLGLHCLPSTLLWVSW